MSNKVQVKVEETDEAQFLPAISARLDAALRSNDALPEADVARIEHELNRRRSYARCIISAIQVRLDAFSAWDNDLATRLQDLYSVTRSCKQLPDDVLCRIFKYMSTYRGLENDPYEASYTSLRLTDGPWLPSYVCKRWRRVALSSPALWTDIALWLDPKGAAKAEPFLLGLQLLRSKSLPLRIRLDCGNLQLDYNDPYIVALAPTTARWKKFTLYATAGTMSALTPALGLFPKLSEVDVRLLPAQSGKGHSGITPITWLKDCSTIRHLTCAGPDFPYKAESIPWHLLTHFSIHCDISMDLPDLCTLLAKMPRLQSLSMKDVRFVDAKRPLIAGILLLPCLERLSLLARCTESSYHTDATYRRLLETVTTPKLRHLDTVLDLHNVRSLVNFILRSKRSLDSLGLQALHWEALSTDARSFWKTVRSTAGLSILRDTDSKALVTLLRDLSFVPKDSRAYLAMPLPRLHHLAVEVSLRKRFATEEVMPALAGLLMSRATALNASVDPLQSVTFAFNLQPCDEVHKATIERCRAAGMSISSFRPC